MMIEECLWVAQVDQYFTVQPHTLVRQHLDYSHWYDRSKLTLKDIHNTQYVSCMNPTAGSFTINTRLQRHFCVFALSFPGTDALTTIYNSILSQHMAHSNFSVRISLRVVMIIIINNNSVWTYSERSPRPQAMTGRSLSVPESFGAGATLQRCRVTWHVASPWLHGLMIFAQLCVMLIFKLLWGHIYRGSKNKIVIIDKSNLHSAICRDSEAQHKRRAVVEKKQKCLSTWFQTVVRINSRYQPPRTSENKEKESHCTLRRIS